MGIGTINNNVSQTMQRYFDSANALTAKSIEKIASGKKINSAADDAAGLAIGEKMNAALTGMDAASRNAQDAISMVRTADGAMGQVSDIMNRMNELAVTAGNGILSADQRQSLQDEFSQLSQEVDRIGKSTSFNGNKLFDGATYTMQVGANTGDTMDIKMGQISSNALGLDSIDLTSQSGAANALKSIKDASSSVSQQRGKMGAAENGLKNTYNNLTESSYNLTDSLSRVMDTDIAKESMKMSISNVLSQTSMAMASNAGNMMSYNVMNMLMK